MVPRQRPRRALAVLTALVTAAATAVLLPPAAVAAPTRQTAACTDGGGVRWSVTATWGGSYVAADGTPKIALESVRWTTTAKRALPTDSRVRTYAGTGKLLQDLSWTGSFSYQGGKASRSRNPVNPPLGTGLAKVRVSLGVDGDGHRSCTVTLSQPAGGAVPAVSGAPRPAGVSGAWSLLFDENFDGTTLSDRWASSWFRGSRMNNVSTSPRNVAVGGGVVTLTPESSRVGALISTNPDDAAERPFEFRHGYAEARIWFPGDGELVYNWPAWWINGQDHPRDGEHDIAEGLGRMTVNYHSSSGAHNQGQVPGSWTNGFHTYGIDRQPGRASVYFDGKLVKTYATDDSESPQYLILNVGHRTSSGGRNVHGAAGAMKVDYVRVWQRA